MIDQSSTALKEVLSRSPDDVWLIVENCAGMGSQIGASFQEIGRLLEAIDSPRVKVCLDTQHCFAAGYDLADPDAIDGVMEEFDREVGLSRLVAVHANDSKMEAGSGVDRHENIGEGHMGEAGFEVILGTRRSGTRPSFWRSPGWMVRAPTRRTWTASNGSGPGSARRPSRPASGLPGLGDVQNRIGVPEPKRTFVIGPHASLQGNGEGRASPPP